MATSNDVMAEIAAYSAANGRPCPAKHLTDKFGADAITLIATLKNEGKIYARRGRTGGLVANENLPHFTTPTLDTDSAQTHATPADALAAEFAALAEKLAQEENAAAVANG